MIGTIQNAFAKIDDKDALMTDQNQAVLLTVNNTKNFCFRRPVERALSDNNCGC